MIISNVESRGGGAGELVRSGMSEHTRGDRSMLPRESIKFCCLEMTTNAYKTVVIFYHEVNPREDRINRMLTILSEKQQINAG